MSSFFGGGSGGGGGGNTETVYAVTGTTPALSPTNGTIQTWALTGNSTPTEGTWDDGASILLCIDDGTAYTANLTGVVDVWIGLVTPVLTATNYTMLSLFKIGSTIYGVIVGYSG